MANARQIALMALYEIEYNGAYSNIALKNALKNNNMEAVSRHFITKLVYGTVQWKLTLDYIIQQYSKIKLKKISKYILLILRMGVYQLLWMDKVPASAAVNESVKLAKRYGHGASAGFVNGLLHTVAREKDRIVYPQDECKRLSVQYSFSEPMVERWISLFDRTFTEALLQAMNGQAKMSVRVNTLKTSPDVLSALLCNRGIHTEVSPLCSDALLTDGFDVAGSDLYMQGLFTVQDISAMLAATVLNPAPGEHVMDLCAAPGGKTTHMAQLMNNQGEIKAFDLHPHKVELIKKNAQRLGITIINACCMDSSVGGDKYREWADKILADVPCSGLGIIRKKPDIKWSTASSELESIQYAILNQAAEYLKPGGSMVYSTCTIEPRENEEQIKRFLHEHPEFEPIDITEDLPEPIRKLTAKDGYVTFYPNIDGIDGFFICKLQKR